MSTKDIGMALGSIASYAVSKEVPYVRVIFCDASAYDAGYLAPEDIAGRVEVKNNMTYIFDKSKERKGLLIYLSAVH